MLQRRLGNLHVSLFASLLLYVVCAVNKKMVGKKKRQARYSKNQAECGDALP